jgi:hypothetical protein
VASYLDVKKKRVVVSTLRVFRIEYEVQPPLQLRGCERRRVDVFASTYPNSVVFPFSMFDVPWS